MINQIEESALNGMVAIVDDHRQTRDRLASYARTGGLEPFVFEERLPSVASLVGKARKMGAKYAVCDHRLFERHYQTFYGAEAVAGFYDSGSIAPILLTGYEREDAETSIRKYRRKDTGFASFKGALAGQAHKRNSATRRRETVKGIVPPERQPCPAVMTVTELDTVGKETLVRVIIAQWSPDEDGWLPTFDGPER